MSLQFSDTTNKNGIVELIEDLTGTQSSTTSSYSLVKKTRDINNALNNFFMLANQASGRWQLDDTNHTDYPVVYGDIVSGQQDYSFTVDEGGNQILDIYKVRIKDSAGNWHTLIQRDLMDGNDTPLNSTTQTSCPTEFDITANGIFLTDIPNYNSTDGLEIYTSRTPSYFASTDTTKKPGIPDMFHEYLALRPAYFWCLQKGKPEAKAYAQTLYGFDGRSGMELAIQNYYTNRNRDERARITVKQESNR